MRPIKSKRIQLYLRMPSGFLAIGTDPSRSWLMTGGRLRARSDVKQGRSQCSRSS
jgi:hypothetical protein